MGAWSDFKKLLFEPESNSRSIKISTNYLTSEELGNYENSLYGQLQDYEDELKLIESIMPEESSSLKIRIIALKTKMEKTNNEESIEIVNEFNQIKIDFDKIKKRADGLYILDELKKQINNMKKCFDKVPFSEEGLTKEKLNDYKKWIKRIQDNVDERDLSGNPVLEKVDKIRFYSLSMEVGYRIKLLDLMYQIESKTFKIDNPFNNLSTEETKRYSSFLQDDIEEMENQAIRIVRLEEAFKNYSGKDASMYISFFERFKKLEQSMSDILANATMVNDISIREVFDSNNKKIDSFDFLKKFVEYKILLNKLEAKIPEIVKEKIKQTKKEEEKRAKQERLKNLTSKEIEAEIYRIEHDVSATGSRYVNILDFQKKVAIAKGLLDRSQSFQSDELEYLVYDISELFNVIRNANTAGISYYLFPNCQENANGKNLLVVSKSDAEILNKTFNLELPEGVTNSGYSYVKNFGTYPMIIAKIVLKELVRTRKNEHAFLEYTQITASKNKSNRDYYDLHFTGMKDYYFNYVKKEYERAISDLRNDIMFTTRYDNELSLDMKDIMPYIQIPSTKNIIPILEKFKSYGITPYIEPNPMLQKDGNSRNEEERNNIHIYFERKDLEKVEKLIKDGTLFEIKVRDNKELIKEFKRKIDWSNDFIDFSFGR